jgi:hypothetical protein
MYSAPAVQQVSSGPVVTANPVMRGPIARVHKIPARPKPGRKPASDEPANKRTEQNRMAQRAFRERQKSHYVQMAHERDGLLEDVKRLEVDVAGLSAQNNSLRTENANLIKFAQGCQCQPMCAWLPKNEQT